MRLFIDALPFAGMAHEVSSPDWPTPIRLKPFQVLLWVSLSPRDSDVLPPSSRRLPVLMDTGHSHTLSLTAQHLSASGLQPPHSWAGNSLRVRDSSGTEHTVPRLYVDLWLHSNIPALASPPYPLRLGNWGIACYPANLPVSGPHLPLLGLAGLCAASVKLELTCNPTGGTLSVWVPDPQP